MDFLQKQKDIISSWTNHGQGHVFQFLDQLNETEKNNFFAQLEVRVRVLNFYQAICLILLENRH